MDLIYDMPSILRSVKKTMFEPKMKVAIYDKDIKARTIKKYPISPNGHQISIKRGGKANFNPEFDNDCVIKIKVPFWKVWKAGWEELCLVPQGASRCINFKTQEVTGPNEDDVKRAAENTLLTNLGKEKQETPTITYISVILLVLVLMRLFGVV